MTTTTPSKLAWPTNVNVMRGPSYKFEAVSITSFRAQADIFHALGDMRRRRKRSVVNHAHEHANDNAVLCRYVCMHVCMSAFMYAAGVGVEDPWLGEKGNLVNQVEARALAQIRGDGHDELPTTI